MPADDIRRSAAARRRVERISFVPLAPSTAGNSSTMTIRAGTL
jgi:hypothetical protein